MVNNSKQLFITKKYELKKKTFKIFLRCTIFNKVCYFELKIFQTNFVLEKVLNYVKKNILIFVRNSVKIIVFYTRALLRKKYANTEMHKIF